jgi:hypothetical protein
LVVLSNDKENILDSKEYEVNKILNKRIAIKTA